MNLQTFFGLRGTNGASSFPLLLPKFPSIYASASLSQSQAKQRAGHGEVGPVRSIHRIERHKGEDFPFLQISKALYYHLLENVAQRISWALNIQVKGSSYY